MTITNRLSNYAGVGGFKIYVLSDQTFNDESLDWAPFTTNINSITFFGIGDLNDDGINDFAMSNYAPFTIDRFYGGSYSAAMIVVYGKSGWTLSDIYMANLNPSGINLGFTFDFYSSQYVCAFGISYHGGIYSIGGGYDINGDKIADMIGGLINTESTGEAFVIYGSSNLELASIDDIDGSNGFVITGNIAGGNCGHSVATIPDINGDEIGEILIGAPNLGNGEGMVYVIFGDKPNIGANFDVGSINGTNGFVIIGKNMDALGYSVSFSNINNDAYNDVVVGAPGDNDNTGAVYIIYGGVSFESTIQVQDLNGKNGFAIYGETGDDWFGYSLSYIGDLNSDKCKDIAIGSAVSSSSSYLKSYVLYGCYSNYAAQTFANQIGTNLPGIKIISPLNNHFLSSHYISYINNFSGNKGDALVISEESSSLIYVLNAYNDYPAILNLSNISSNIVPQIKIIRGSTSGTKAWGVGDINYDGLGDICYSVPIMDNTNNYLPGSIGECLFGY